MGRVNSVSAKGASVEFSRREVTVTGEDNSENIEINIEVHMDGDSGKGFAPIFPWDGDMLQKKLKLELSMGC